MFKLKLKTPTNSEAKSAPIKIKLGKTDAVQDQKKPNIKLKFGSKGKTKSNGKSQGGPKVTPKLRFKMQRIPGEGYDSEDSEAEEDPLREEALILRLLPDAELDYVRHCVEAGDLSKIQMKWKDRYRCVLSVNKTLYAAKLMNLPNIIEAQKTVDKKNIFKTVDVSQILVVIKRISDESEIEDISPGEEDFDSGITPPLKNVGKSKYRRKMTKQYIENIEARVDELLRLDEEAEESTYEMIDPDSLAQYDFSKQGLQKGLSHQRGQDDQHTGQHPGQEHEQGQQQGQQQGQEQGETFMEDDHIVVPKASKDDVEEPLDEDLELELEQALEEDDDEEEEDDEDDEDDDDNSDNERGDVHCKVEIDEDQQQNALLKDEITDLLSTIESNKAKLSKTSNPLMRNRIIDTVKKLEKELENKNKQLKTNEDRRKSKNDGKENQSEEPGNGEGEGGAEDEREGEAEGEGEEMDEDEDEEMDEDDEDEEDEEDEGKDEQAEQAEQADDLQQQHQQQGTNDGGEDDEDDELADLFG